MRGYPLYPASGLLPVLMLIAGCPGGGGGNTNSNANDNSLSFEQSVVLDLTTNGQFDFAGSESVESHFSVSIAEALGMSTLDAFAVALDPGDVELTAADPNGVGTNGIDTNGLTTLDVLVGALEDPNVCASGVALGRFELTIGSNGSVLVDPAELPASASALSLVEGGDFELCLRAASDAGGTLTLDRLTLRFNATAPELNCSEIMALAQVRDALDLLADEGLFFDLRRGSTPPDITGSYTVTHAVEFDPDGSDERELPTRTDTFSNQSEGAITRETGRVELEQSIVGSTGGVSLCVLARSNNPDCDQTIARVESYDVGTNGAGLEGSFLAVVIERHPSDAADCGPPGDFIFGSITLTSEAGTNPPPSPNVNDNENGNGNANANGNDNRSDNLNDNAN